MDLKKKYGRKYRVTREESFDLEKEERKRSFEWRYQEIRGKYGYVYPYGMNQPAVTWTSITVANRYIKRGWKIIQNGEDERTCLIPLEDLDQVIIYIRPRKRRQLSEEAKKLAISRLMPFRKVKTISPDHLHEDLRREKGENDV